MKTKTSTLDSGNGPAQARGQAIRWSVGIALGLLSPLSASAQDAPLEEVLVSAQRRMQNIMDVPVSVASYSPEQLEQQGIRQIDDLSRLTPSLKFSRTSGVSGNNSSDIS